jgi:hypothetical protein
MTVNPTIGPPGHGPDDSWTGFILTPEPDSFASAAAAAIEYQVAEAGVRSDANSVRHCCIAYSDYVHLATETVYHGRLDARLSAAVLSWTQSGPRRHDKIDPEISHFVFRACQWEPLGEQIAGMSTYIAPLYSRRSRSGIGGGKLEYETYPPAPLANTLFAVFPGPCEGQYVFSREAGFFVANGKWRHSPWLIEQLNAPAVIQHLTEIMARDMDYIGDSLFRREYFLMTQAANRPLGPERGTDPYFLPTLFENEPFNYRGWPGYQQRPTPRYKGFHLGKLGEYRVNETTSVLRNFDPAKYFALVLLPFRSSTLVVATWPVVSTFGRKGGFLGADFAMPHLGHLLGHLRQLLSDPRSQGSAPTPELDYWNLADQVTVYPDSKSRRKEFNLAIPPLEWALAAAPTA